MESCFLVVWEDDEDGNIHGARVNSTGEVLDSLGLAISTAPRGQYTPRAGSNGRDFLVVWEDWRSDTEGYIYGSRVTPDGQVLDTSGIAVSGALVGMSPSVAGSDGNGFMVDWVGCNYFNTAIYCARVSADGALVDTSGTFVASFWLDPDALFFPRLALACNGRDFLAVWGTDEGYVGSARISREGVPYDTLGSPVILDTLETWNPAVASNGDGWFVVWEDYRTDADIYGARVAADGAVRDSLGILLSSSVNNQDSPAESFNSSLFFVVWESWDPDYEVSNVYGIRIGPDGAILDSAGFRICTAPGNPYEPAVGSDGADFLAVWVDGRGGRQALYGARVTGAGTLLDSSGIPISSGADRYANPAVAFDGVNYLVVWEAAHGDSDDIRGARVTRSGNVLDTTALPISLALNRQYAPAVAFGDTTCLVVWGDHRGSAEDIYAARVTRSGHVLDPRGRAISFAAGDQFGPSIAYDGRQFLATWCDGRNGSTDIYGARVTAGGEVLDPNGIAISRSDDAKWRSAVGFDDSNFAVVWEDWNDDIAMIHGARVSRSGAVLDSGRVLGQLGDEETPSLAHGPGTELFLVYSGWTDVANGHRFQAYRLWGRFDPFPGEARPMAAQLTPGSEMSILRDVLVVPTPLIPEARTRHVLVNATGRKVLDLHPGDNDVSGLAPGIYFQVRRTAGLVDNRRKVVVVR